MLGMHGSYAANMAMSETDLVIALGARFDDRVTGKLSEFAKHAGVIHVDIDPASISKLVNADYPIVGDVKNVVSEMIELAKDNVDAERYVPWLETVEHFDKLHPLRYHEDTDNIKPQWVVQRIGELLGDDANISTDVGQHQMWAAQFYPFTRARQWISSGGLGTMGFGFPAAIGVKRGAMDKVSINITGDGSILMNIQELMTAVEYKLPVINVILNNNYLGMVRQWQTLFYNKRHSSTDLSVQPDFVMLAESFGGVGYRVSTKEEFDAALKDAVEKNVVAIIDVKVERLENVLPMVPSGGSLFNMMLLENKES
jgi:acetolactate synthase-1/2/3 large subunit